MNDVPSTIAGIIAGILVLGGAAGGLVWYMQRGPNLPGMLRTRGRAAPDDDAPDQGDPLHADAAATLLPGARPGFTRAGPAGVFDRIGDALSRTRATFSAVFGSFTPGRALDDAAWAQLEEALIRADMGPRTAAGLVAQARETQVPVQELKGWLTEEIRQRISRFDFALAANVTAGGGPTVILVVGVNGAGKTTTIGKLASRYKLAGKSVMLGAGDTFRAGAIDQLKVWGERAGVPVVAHQEGADPAAVCHDTVKSALAKGIEVVILDTAGRLQAHAALMAELGKIVRVVQKLLPSAPHEVLLVLDGTMGQNALAQARVFKEVTHVTGIALTKLDGTAKGGVVVAIAEELNLPVKLVGCGEKLDDLRDFDPEAFAKGLFG